MKKAASVSSLPRQQAFVAFTCISGCSNISELLPINYVSTHRLSGGEKKLVSLATVLVMQPKALLLDEPTTGLDEKARLAIASLLNHLDMSMVIVSHEYDFLAEIAQKIYSMKGGRIECDGDAGTPP